MESELSYLLLGCRRGEKRSWDCLLQQVRATALRIARSQYRLSPEDSEDVAQAVQLRVTQRLSQLRSADAFPTWLRRLVNHVALDWLRRQKPALSLDDPECPVDLPADEGQRDPYARVVMKLDLGRALSSLPDRYRQPIQMHVLGGLPQDEVGRILGRTRSTVATQIERGLRRLRRTMDAEYPR